MNAEFALPFVLAACLSGCTSVDVRPLPAENHITNVLIRENPKVAVDDFLDVLIEGFERHGIATKVVSETADVKDAYVVTYVAHLTWDLKPYLVRATINIEKESHRIAHAEYHLVGGGGLDVMKWEGTKAKIGPVIDELLKGFNKSG